MQLRSSKRLWPARSGDSNVAKRLHYDDDLKAPTSSLAATAKIHPKRRGTITAATQSILQPKSSNECFKATAIARRKLGDCNFRLRPNGNARGSVQASGIMPSNEMDRIKVASRVHLWHWDDQDKSHECVVENEAKLDVCFHPQCSESAAAIRGSEPLTRDRDYYYWEVTVFDKCYGTSVMFGLCTKEQKLHVNDFCNLVGLDRNGWSLSHKGLIWHDGKHSRYSDMFPPNQTVTVGLLYNTVRGELSYFMNGKNLGVAFLGLDKIKENLYPVVGSTAKGTRMRLTGSYCGYTSLMERSTFALLKLSNALELSESLTHYGLPRTILIHLAEMAKVCGSQTEITAQLDRQNCDDKR